MASGGSNFNDFPKNQFTKFHAVLNSINANRDNDIPRNALNAGRSSQEKVVCLSVRLSIKRVHCDKTEEKSVQFLYHTKDYLA